MRLPFQDHIEFFKQFRARFTTTGAVAPSSRFLAHAMIGPLKKRSQPARVLEVGPGTGAVTRHIVRQLGAEDRLDLVELNEAFADMLTRRFEQDALYQRVAKQAKVHVCPLQEFDADEPYDYIISGLPMNNFSSELVAELFARFFQLLKPGGVLSYFEYMYVRPVRTVLSAGQERERLKGLSEIMGGYVSERRFRRNWVFINVPPAWVQHLRA